MPVNMRFTRVLPALLLAFTLVHAAPADAPKIENLHATGFVNDFSSVVDPGSKQAIESLCRQLDRKTASQISVVTIPTLGGEPIEDFANKLYRAWGIGRKESKGALLLVVTQDRKTRLEIGYGLEPLLPDGFDGSVLREMRPSLATNQYGPAILSGVRLLAQRVAEKSGVQLDAPAPPDNRVITRRTRTTPFGMSWTTIIFLIIFLLVILFNRGGPFIGGFGGGSWGGGGGGGRRNDDDGGGFGGFGGGDSGGGGASSDF